MVRGCRFLVRFLVLGPHPARSARYPLPRCGSGCGRGAVLASAVAILFSGCTVGPDYRRPDAPIPAQYKEAGWKVGEPSDAIDRGAWWSVYKDPVLDDLEKQIDISNQ